MCKIYRANCFESSSMGECKGSFVCGRNTEGEANLDIEELKKMNKICTDDCEFYIEEIEIKEGK